MEKGPEFKIVGGAPEEEKQKIKEEETKALFDHFNSLSPEEQEQLRKFELPKSEKELAIIDLANRETNKLREKFGLESYDIPAENHHLISPELYKK